MTPLVDTAVLTLTDWERIRRNAFMPSKEEELTSKRIETEQRDAQLAKARALKERLVSYDKTHNNKYLLSDIERENIERDKAILERAEKILDHNEDAVKQMDKLVLYAKTATIRDRQKEEMKQNIQLYKKKEAKEDLMMELDRLKELKLQEERETARKIQNREGSLVIIDQIKDRERKMKKYKELIEKERQEMVKHMKEMEEEEKRINEQKRIQNEIIAKEIEQSNIIAAAAKEKKKQEERELDLKILKYNIEKAKKEEAELKEKKRIQEEKEKEVQKLRERQEKAQDKQSELDALRAKRAFEETERQTRIKEKNDLIMKQKKLEELLAANERQKIDKELKLAEQAKQEQEEYEKIVQRQMEEIEQERRIAEERKRMRYEHNFELQKMIKLREEKNKLEQREVLEEGRKIRQKNDGYREKMERIKQEKIKELKALNVQPKYIADLERFKIV